MRTFQATWQKWRTARDATLVPAARAKDYQAYVDAQKVTSPLSAQASSELQAVAKTEQVRATANARSARQTYTSARTLIIAIVLVGLVIALSGALHVTRLVVRPLKAVSAILDRVADGDLTGRAEVTGHTVIASAVEEQTSTTHEMGRSATEAATAADDIAANIASVAAAARSTSEGVTRAETAAAELARASGQLQHLVSRFRYEG